MKRYLYEIDRNGVLVQGIPYMPRALAEKTAKQANKGERQRFGRNAERYTISKTTLLK